MSDVVEITLLSDETITTTTRRFEIRNAPPILKNLERYERFQPTEAEVMFVNGAFGSATLTGPKIRRDDTPSPTLTFSQWYTAVEDLPAWAQDLGRIEPESEKLMDQSIEAGVKSVIGGEVPAALSLAEDPEWVAAVMVEANTYLNSEPEQVQHRYDVTTGAIRCGQCDDDAGVFALGGHWICGACGTNAPVSNLHEIPGVTDDRSTSDENPVRSLVEPETGGDDDPSRT